MSIGCITDARVTNVLENRKEDKCVLKRLNKAYHWKHCNVTFKTCFSDVFLPTETQSSTL